MQQVKTRTGTSSRFATVSSKFRNCGRITQQLKKIPSNAMKIYCSSIQHQIAEKINSYT